MAAKVEVATGAAEETHTLAAVEATKAANKAVILAAVVNKVTAAKVEVKVVSGNHLARKNKSLHENTLRLVESVF